MIIVITKIQVNNKMRRKRHTPENVWRKHQKTIIINYSGKKN